MGAEMEIFLHIIAIVTPVLTSICLYVLRDIRTEQKLLREDMERYVRSETCRAHRESLQQQIDTLRKCGK